MSIRNVVQSSVLLLVVQACASSGERIQGPGGNKGPLFVLYPGGSTVLVSIKGQTFIGDQGAFLTPTRSRCYNVLVSWYPDSLGLFHPYPQPEGGITGDGGISTYAQKQCGAVQPAGGGTSINGGQIQVIESLNGPDYNAFSIPADLSKEGLLIDHPAGAVVTLTGQPASGSCTFDQWRVNGVTSYDNPISLTVQENLEIVGWFVCGGTPPPPPGPPPPPPPDTCIICPPSQD